MIKENSFLTQMGYYMFETEGQKLLNFHSEGEKANRESCTP